jgi:preprotein translocase subunit SecA
MINTNFSNLDYNMFFNDKQNKTSDDLDSELLTLTEITEDCAKNEIVKDLPTSITEEDLEKRMVRFFKDDSIKFPMNEEQIYQIFKQYEYIQGFCKKQANITLNKLVELANAIRQKAKKEALKQEEVLELLAIGRLAIHLEFGIYLYSTQVLVVLGLIASGKNHLAQVKTGEGKTVVIALLAFVLAMQGRAVDIITSSRSLAIRDQKQFNHYFEIFGVTSSHICSEDQKREQFKGQILYGPVTDFEFAFMREKLFGVSLYGARPMENFDCAIVDEVDNLVIDTASNSARISYPSEESYHWVYDPISQFVIENFTNGFIIDGQASELRKFLNKAMPISYKEPLAKLTDEQLEIWMTSAYQAYYKLKENVDYIIAEKKNWRNIVLKKLEIVDTENTGGIMSSSRWSQGIHEFLEVKHEMTVENESLTPIALSHSVFYGFYKTILGISGTLGDVEERAEIDKIYDIQCFDIPSNLPNRRVDAAPQILETNKEYIEAIKSSIMRESKQGRPILVLCLTIKDSIELGNVLKLNEVNYQLLNAVQECSEETIISRAGKPGVVTIATNVAGRGTNINLSKKSIEAGGLHVILTFYPTKRVEDQGKGRAGRNGEPGSTEMFLSIEKIKTKSSIGTLLKDVFFDSSSLTSKEWLVLLEMDRVNFASEIKDLHIERSSLQRVCFSFSSQFFEAFQKWNLAMSKDEFLEKQSNQLKDVKLEKSIKPILECTQKKDMIIAEECVRLLTTHTVDSKEWKILLRRAIDRLKHIIITHWSLAFHHKMESFIKDTYPISNEKLQEKLSILYNENKSLWEHYLGPNGMFVFLKDLTGIEIPKIIEDQIKKDKIQKWKDSIVRIRDAKGEALPLSSCSDEKLKEFIKLRIPINTYSRVTVTTVNESFIKNEQKITVRHIQIKQIKSSFYIFYKLFLIVSLVFNILFKRESLYNKAINETSLLTYLMNSSKLEDGGKEEEDKRIIVGKSDLQAAYYQYKTINIAIPNECNHKPRIEFT